MSKLLEIGNPFRNSRLIIGICGVDLLHMGGERVNGDNRHIVFFCKKFFNFLVVGNRDNSGEDPVFENAERIL